MDNARVSVRDDHHGGRRTSQTRPDIRSARANNSAKKKAVCCQGCRGGISRATASQEHYAYRRKAGEDCVNPEGADGDPL